MNQGNGYLLDASGKSHHGVRSNGTMSVDDSRAGRAVFFDGSNDYVRVEDASDLRMGTNSFTVAFWVKPEAGDGLEYLVVKGCTAPEVAGDTGWSVRLNHSNNKIEVRLSDGTTQAWVPFAITNGVWAHVAIVVDRSAGTM
ncbi:MAG: LamG domain-containing protein [SAR202 cluster bacterium]|nr:LamG domain-containing protein [SAR202 cluster bacterium]